MSGIQMSKSQMSDPFFKEAKVVSCSQVLVKNGQAVAVAFGGSGKLRDNSSGGKSSFRDSLSQYLLQASPLQRRLQNEVRASCGSREETPRAIQSPRLSQQTLPTPSDNALQELITDCYWRSNVRSFEPS